MAADEAVDPDASLDTMLAGGEDDKTYAAMGVAKTLGTIVSSIDRSPEILAQVQEVIIPIVTFTFKNKILGGLLTGFSCIYLANGVGCRPVRQHVRLGGQLDVQAARHFAEPVARL